MSAYKLHITLDIDDLSIEGDNPIAIAVSRAKRFLEDTNLVIDGKNRYDGIDCNVSLIRENDKSAANLLAPINEKHYKHHKVPITEVVINKIDLDEFGPFE